MENFTPFSSLFGGALIGLAAVMLLFLNGRIAGVSGIASGLLVRPVQAGDTAWRVAFVLGLIVGPLLIVVLTGAQPNVEIVASPWMIVVAGLLVGFGTALGSGCTSGHGVCGIARLSLRSLIATTVFMIAGGLTVFFVRHALAGG